MNGNSTVRVDVGRGGDQAVAHVKQGVAGISLALNTSPVCPSIAAATTDRAFTSSPTLARSQNTGPCPPVG